MDWWHTSRDSINDLFGQLFLSVICQLWHTFGRALVEMLNFFRTWLDSSSHALSIQLLYRHYDNNLTLWILGSLIPRAGMNLTRAYVCSTCHFYLRKLFYADFYPLIFPSWYCLCSCMVYDHLSPRFGVLTSLW